MALSESLLRQFAKAINQSDDSEAKVTTCYATVKSITDSGASVLIDGADSETEIRTLSSVSVDDRVLVQVKNHKMTILGNATDVSASGSVTYRQEDGTFGINADKITAGTIDASKINVNNLNASNITSGTIDASKIEVDNLSADSITTGTLDTTKAKIANLNGKWITNASIIAKALSGDMIETALGCKVYYQPEQPTDPADRDIWYVTVAEKDYDPRTDVIKMYNAETSSWETVADAVTDIFMANVITAQNIVAHSIGAAQLTVADVNGENGWINFANGTFSYSNEKNTNGIAFDGDTLTVKGSIEIQPGDIGIRNYVKNSKTLSEAAAGSYNLAVVGTGIVGTSMII